MARLLTFCKKGAAEVWGGRSKSCGTGSSSVGNLQGATRLNVQCVSDMVVSLYKLASLAPKGFKRWVNKIGQTAKVSGSTIGWYVVSERKNGNG